MRSEAEVNRVIEEYADTVKRVCFLYLKNHTDTEDIFQKVFLKYALSSAVFENPEHEKAWFIQRSIKECKDLLKSFFKRQTMPLEAALEQMHNDNNEHLEVMEAVLKLPPKYRNVIYLHYYEGYSAPQIGEILSKNVNTVYTLLTRARDLLRKELGGDSDGA